LQSQIDGFLPPADLVLGGGPLPPLGLPQRGKELVQDQGKRHMQGETKAKGRITAGISQCGGDIAALQ
jgi:hypothetical protein